MEPGLQATVEHTVTSEDTASSLGSGDVDVLGTPKVVAMCEAAAVAAVAGEELTVGVRIDLEHVAPTGIGQKVTAHARLAAVDGRALTFELEASDPAGVIARGTHVRVIVDRVRFMASVRDRG